MSEFLDALTHLDERLFLLINGQLSHEHLDNPMLSFSELGSWTVFLVAGALLSVEGGPRLRRHLVVLVVTLVSLSAGVRVLKETVDRDRPIAHFKHEIADGQVEVRILEGKARRSKSMPSGHTATGFACMAYCALRLRRCRVFAWILAALIGYSRVYLGQHFLSDVIAGAALGTLWAWLADRVYERWSRWRPLPPAAREAAPSA